jgi:hypothetical protein
MFPPTQLQQMLALTNYQLRRAGKPMLSKGELLKFFGILILMTKFEFMSRRHLWSTTATSKYLPPPSLGKTGMSKNRFENIFRYIRWSDQPSVRQQSLSSEQYRWSLMDDFMENFNAHCAQNVSPSERICVDESIS